MSATFIDRFLPLILKFRCCPFPLVPPRHILTNASQGTWLKIETNYTPDVLPAGYQDEWSYCAAVGKDVCGPVLERHYESFVTRADIDRIAQYGIDTLRIPTSAWPSHLLVSPSFRLSLSFSF